MDHKHADVAVQPHDMTDHVLDWVMGNYGKLLNYVFVLFFVLAIVGAVFGVYYVWQLFGFLLMGTVVAKFLPTRVGQKAMMAIGIFLLVYYVVAMAMPGTGFPSPLAGVVIVVLGVVMYLGMIAFGILAEHYRQMEVEHRHLAMRSMLAEPVEPVKD
jgi:MFS family permease